jgi:hypothetical protein
MACAQSWGTISKTDAVNKIGNKLTNERESTGGENSASGNSIVLRQWSLLCILSLSEQLELTGLTVNSRFLHPIQSICYHKIAQKGGLLTKQGVNSVFYVEK